jgi:hypothetical protein
LYPTALEERQGLEKTAGSLSELFGADRVKDAIRIEANELNERRNSGAVGIGSGGLLTALSRSGSAAVPRNQFFGR